MSSNRVVIFSKSADLGQVKTRMRPQLSSEQCLSLHIALLKDTLDKIRSLSSVIYLAGSGHLPFDTELPIHAQEGDDLGLRMKNAFLRELSDFSKVVIIGTDAPTMPVDEIVRAFRVLNNKDVVFGPSPDGGYYLIGLRKIIPEVFDDIPWGTDRVLIRTLEKLDLNSYALLTPYFDVDVPQDLTRLKQDLESHSDLALVHTREWFSELL